MTDWQFPLATHLQTFAEEKRKVKAHFPLTTQLRTLAFRNCASIPAFNCRVREKGIIKMSKMGLIATLGILAAACSTGVVASSDDEVSYAGDLWEAMVSKGLAGENLIESRPYVGTEPHGAVLQTLKTQLSVGEHSGQLVVKRNYGPAGVTPAEVWADPDKYLAAVTVMYRRESGYAPEAGDWFWAKFKPDGSLDSDQSGKKLAGKVESCAACHQGARDDDFIFANDG